MGERESEIRSQGGQIVVVSFATPETVAEHARWLGLPFRWFADPGREGYRRLCQRGGASLDRNTVGATVQAIWNAARRGRSWRPRQRDVSQLGGDFVFGTDGVLTLAHPQTNAADRPAVGELIAALRHARGAEHGG